MATFLKWRELFERGDLRRCTFVYGPERLLVEEVVDQIRARVRPHDLDYASFVVGDDPEREVWEAFDQYPGSPTGRRLVVVRDAQNIERWDALDEWFDTRRIPQVVAVLVSAEETVNPEAAHIARVRKTGRIVRCGPLTEDEAVRYLENRFVVEPAVARRLLRRVSSFTEAVNALEKLRIIGVTAEDPQVEAVTTRAPAEDFVEELCAMHKANAMAAARLVSAEELPRLIGALDFRLEVLARLHVATLRGLKKRDIVANTKLPPPMVERLSPHARHYDPGSVRKRTRMLAFVDSRVSAGDRDGLLEALTALW